MKLTCRNCQHEGTPLEVKGGVACPKCQHPYDYFQAALYLNNKKEQKLAQDRLSKNNQLLRGIKKK